MLEGIGLIQKKLKNKIQWVGSSSEPDDPMASEISELSKELEDLKTEERKLDFWKSQIQDSLGQLTEDPSYNDFAYITYDDIKNLPKLTDSQSETLLAIRAPSGTNLEVPNPESFPPEEKEKYQIALQSKTGEILVYVITSDKSSEKNANSSKISAHIVDDLPRVQTKDSRNKRNSIDGLYFPDKS